jgi:hypothetical protein
MERKETQFFHWLEKAGIKPNSQNLMQFWKEEKEALIII